MKPERAADPRDGLLDEFYTEADEHLGSMRTQLAALESLRDTLADRQAPLESLFRSVHSLKGIAAMAGLPAVVALAHASEELLRPLSGGRSALDAATLELLFEATRAFEQMIAASRVNEAVVPAAALERRLNDAANAAGDAVSAPALPAPSLARSAGEPEPLAEALRGRGLHPWRATFTPARERHARGLTLEAIRERLGREGEVARVAPIIQSSGTIVFELLVGFRTEPSNLPAWAADGVVLAPFFSASAPVPAPRETAGTTSPLALAPSHIVRVEISRLDDLMRLAGELMIHRSTLEERLAHLAPHAGLAEVNQSLARTLRELRGAISRVRMVSLAELFTRLSHAARDLARELGRPLQLGLEGTQTEIDKYIVERLKEPLLHLVRNALSHGIEAADDRVRAGKPAEAQLRLRAGTAGDVVVIEIADDGRGIDRAQVAARARTLGMAVPEVLDDAGVLALICAQGFSTRLEADQVAGRGVGLAVVATTVRELGGQLALTSTPGRGTTFTLRVPLTLSIAKAIIVTVGPHTYAVPQTYVREVVPVTAADVQRVNRTEAMTHRDGLLPLVRLNHVFSLPATSGGAGLALVVSTARGAVGLVVDRVQSHREVVVRSVTDPLLHVRGVAGATELGDGRPVLILDVNALASARASGELPTAGSAVQ